MNNFYHKTLVVLILLIAVFSRNSTEAQDIHFSQFYASPVFLNPAMTGHIEGKYRLNLNYKRQWTGITKTGVYNTPALSFDFNFRKRANSRHSFGAGLGLMNDLSSSNNKLSNLTVMLGLGAHLNLDKNEKHFLSVGINLGMVNRRIKQQNVLFASQLNQGVLDPMMASGENLENTNWMNLDSRLGLIYSIYPSAKTDMKFGFAIFHPLKMDESADNSGHTRPINYVAHAELNHRFKSKFGIQPYFLLMTQANALEITGGTNVSFMFGEGSENSFFVGGGYRVFDGAIALIGVEINKYKLGLSYDVATSDLARITNGRGDFEIAFQILGMSKKANNPVLPALRYF